MIFLFNKKASEANLLVTPSSTQQMKEDMLKLDEIPFEPSTHLEYSSAPGDL